MTDKLKALEDLLPDLEKFPAPVKDNFNKAIPEMPDALSAEQTSDWLKRGIAIAGQTVRSWEAAAHFFQVSPNVISSMPYSYFVRWMECGASLCEESPTLAAAYFEAKFEVKCKALTIPFVSKIEWLPQGKKMK
ncbi:MAG TPA: hypothetical protein QF838_09850, partial [SAR202 cluster bacterium]|nr:hypothetical protein [SAR202 cluster bacterium]